MLRNSLLNFGNSHLHSNLLGVQFLRWRRKPRWLPVAKSKLFRIPEHPKQTEDEKNELFRLHNRYKTQMKSIKSYFSAEYKKNLEISSADRVVVTPEEEEKDFQLRLNLNDEWNKKISMERDKRLQADLKKKEEYVRERLDLAEYRKSEQLEKARERVRKEIEASKNFIKREHLDAKIEEILVNPVDHNFCIDLEKNIHRNSDKN